MDIWYIKVLERLELISVSLPAMDKELPFHVDSFFRFFSCKGTQSLICNLPGPTGTSRYLIANKPA